MNEIISSSLLTFLALLWVFQAYLGCTKEPDSSSDKFITYLFFGWLIWILSFLEWYDKKRAETKSRCPKCGMKLEIDKGISNSIEIEEIIG